MEKKRTKDIRQTTENPYHVYFEYSQPLYYDTKSGSHIVKVIGYSDLYK